MGARVVGLLRFPGDDATLDINFPRARAGAVHAVSGAHDLVVLPAAAVGVFPGAVFGGDLAVAIGKLGPGFGEVGQAVEKMTHDGLRGFRVLAGHRGVLAAVVPPSHKHAQHVKGDEAVQRSLRAAGHGDGTAVALGNEERAVSRDGRGKTNHCSRFLVGVFHRLLLRSRALSGSGARAIGEEDDRNHAEGRAIANTRGGEQQHERGEKTGEVAAYPALRQEIQHGDDAQRHENEVPEGHARATEPVGQPTADRTNEGADERPEPGIVQRDDAGKLRLDQQRKSCRVADERTEGAGVEQAHQPGMRAPENHRLIGEGCFGIGQIIHAEPGRQRGGDDEGHPDKPGVLQPDRCTLSPRHGGLRIAAEHAIDRCGDDQRHDELHDGHAQIAQPGVQPQRQAFLRLGEEKVDIGHRRGEVPAAEAAEQGQNDKDLIWGRRALHSVIDAQRGQQQRGGGNRRPAPPAKNRHHEGIKNAQRGAEQAGQRGQPEQLIGGELEPHLRQLDHHHRPHHPHREGEGQCRNGNPQIALGDDLPFAFPERGVFRVPMFDDMTGHVFS